MKHIYRLAEGPLLQQILAQREAINPIATKIKVVRINPIASNRSKLIKNHNCEIYRFNFNLFLMNKNKIIRTKMHDFICVCIPNL